jgi:hypothetical protein
MNIKQNGILEDLCFPGWTVRIKILPILILILMIFGCATTYPISWKTLPDFNTTYDKAWEVVLDVITSKNIQLDVVEKDAGYIKSTQMSWGNKKFILTVRFASKSPVKVKLQVQGEVIEPFSGVVYPTGIPDLEKTLMDEIEGRLRRFGKK